MNAYPITNPNPYPIWVEGYLINPFETRIFPHPVNLPQQTEEVDKELSKKSVKK
jgi:hypothetical protein